MLDRLRWTNEKQWGTGALFDELRRARPNRWVSGLCSVRRDVLKIRSRTLEARRFLFEGRTSPPHGGPLPANPIHIRKSVRAVPASVWTSGFGVCILRRNTL